MSSKKAKVVEDTTRGNMFARSGHPFVLGEFAFDKEGEMGESLTIPGMSVPLRDLLDRFVQGREVPIQGEPVYEGHLNIEDVRVMDKVEKEEYARKVRAAIGDYQRELQKAKEEEEKGKIAALEAKIAELEARKENPIEE